MPTTLYGTFPILLPGKTVSVSRNGLKKTTGTILFKPGQESLAESLAEDYGSIFPAPQIRTTDMGLLEMSFDAYNDIGTPSNVNGILLVKVAKTFKGYINGTIQIDGATVTYTSLGSFSVIETWVVDSVTFSGVLSASASSYQIPSPSGNLSRSLKRRDVIGRVGSSTPNGPPQSTVLNIIWTQVMSDVTRRNFGALDEVDVTFTLEPTVQ